MRILIEPSGYKLGNMGDAAMLQVTVSRLFELWPEAQLQVITRAPEALAALCPRVSPLLAHGRSAWFLLRHWKQVAEKTGQKGFESFVIWLSTLL